jgi:hypothetical protein
MLWKELFSARTSLLQRSLGLSVVLVLGGLLAWGTVAFALPAFRELAASGYGLAGPGSARAAFLEYLRTVATGVSLVMLLGVASDAAAAITTEHERDTWVSLIATPLTGAEIVRAKLLGAIWAVRHTALVVLALWVAGIASGAVHPVSLLLVTVELASSIFFAAALGTWFSLRSTDTMRALARTLGSLLLAAGGSLLITLPVLSLRPLALVGCTPALLAGSLASYAEILGHRFGTSANLAQTMAARLWIGNRAEMLVTCFASAALSTAAAWGLVRSACRGFDARLDRPTIEAPAEARSAGAHRPRAWFKATSGRPPGRPPRRPSTRHREGAGV